MNENNKLLEAYGWFVECESPFEIRHEDGSFATGQAAYIVQDNVIKEARKILKKNLKSLKQCSEN